jgi:hypothetical protein
MKMLCRTWLLGSFLFCAPLVGSETANASPPDAGDVEATLKRFNQAASRADGATYFALFAPEGIFIGTDATERWTVEQFRAYATPYFSKGKGWTYLPRNRHIQFSPRGDVAWFDEILDNSAYGVCRGSGVLRKEAGTWLICQYHLTIPVPNELAGTIVKIIKGAKATESSSPR